jgi:hypothetical protein
MKIKNRIRMPREFVSFSLCGTCGQTWPSRDIWYNYRWGWQCPECWDGLISRDQIMRPIFPYEGTRKVASPVVPANEGLQPAVDTPYYVYTLYDRDDPTITYDINFGTYITFYSPSVKTGDDGVTPNGGIELNNAWCWYIKGGYAMYSRFFETNVMSRSTWSGAGDMFVDANGYLNYTPYVPGQITGLQN